MKFIKCLLYYQWVKILLDWIDKAIGKYNIFIYSNWITEVEVL